MSYSTLVIKAGCPSLLWIAQCNAYLASQDCLTRHSITGDFFETQFCERLVFYKLISQYKLCLLISTTELYSDSHQENLNTIKTRMSVMFVSNY